MTGVQTCALPIFSQSQNEIWQELKEKMQPLEDELKKVEEQIKMAPLIVTGKSIVDESTGELISPVQKTSTTSINEIWQELKDKMQPLEDELKKVGLQTSITATYFIYFLS